MDKDAVLNILSRFRQSLETRGVRVDRLVLYGSYANGNWREGSDIDVVVISEDFRGRTYWERIDLLTEAIYDLFEPIEAVALTPAEWDDRASLVVDYAVTGEVVHG